MADIKTKRLAVLAWQARYSYRMDRSSTAFTASGACYAPFKWLAVRRARIAIAAGSDVL